MQFLEKIFLPLNIKRDKQNNNLLTDIKNRSIDLLEWLKKAFPYFVNVNNGLTNTIYSGDSTNIQLGGELNQNTEIYFNNSDGDYQGLSFYPSQNAMHFGIQGSPTPSPSSGFLHVLNNDGSIFSSIGNSKAVGEFLKLADGSGQVEFEVSNPDDSIVSALKIAPLYLTFGGYVNASDIFLNLDGDLGEYGIGDLGTTVNGTQITINDITKLVKITNVPTYANDAAAITGGLTTGHLYKTTTGGITALNIVP